jgi:hypothetical protein
MQSHFLCGVWRTGHQRCLWERSNQIVSGRIFTTTFIVSKSSGAPI